MAKKITGKLYLPQKIKLIDHQLQAIRDENGYLFSDGIYRTKILPEDLPEWFVHGYMYKRHGYLCAKGVKHLLYCPNYAFDNHYLKYDNLYISFDKPITQVEGSQYKDYEGWDYVLGGPVIVDFVEAAAKYSEYDVGEIKKELDKKLQWYYERNPKR